MRSKLHFLSPHFFKSKTCRIYLLFFSEFSNMSWHCHIQFHGLRIAWFCLKDYVIRKKAVHENYCLLKINIYWSTRKFAKVYSTRLRFSIITYFARTPVMLMIIYLNSPVQKVEIINPNRIIAGEARSKASPVESKKNLDIYIQYKFVVFIFSQRVQKPKL
jgi:hypothetical protein